MSPQDAVAVCLALHTTVAARHNPFRLGTLGFRWRRRANEIYIPLYFLSERRHDLAQVIMALVRQHGGLVVGAEQTRGAWRRLLRFVLSGCLVGLGVYVLVYLSPITCSLSSR